MPSPIGPLRAAVLAPSAAQLRAQLSGFGDGSARNSDELERVTMALRNGIDIAVRSSNNDEIITAIQSEQPRLHGFAYEGAAVGLTAIDSLSPGHRAADLISGPARAHDLTMYAGVGMALARIPKIRWRKLFPQHPLWKWWAVDGFGFYNAFFRNRRFVRDKHVVTRYPGWMGERSYLLRGHDQGMGRALWFVAGSDPRAVARLVDEFEPHRRADLWTGAGLASTFAGGLDEAGYAETLDAAGQYRTQLRAGSALVARLRTQAGVSDPYTEATMQAFCGRSVAQMAESLETTLTDLPDDGSAATYQLWRGRVAELVASSRT